MNWLKIFKPNIGAGTYTPPPPHIPHPDDSFAPSCPSPPRIPNPDYNKQLKTGGRCISSQLPPQPPEKKPRGRLVPMKDGYYSVQIWQEEYQKFSFIDCTTSIEEGKQKIKDYFEDKDSIINGTINVY